MRQIEGNVGYLLVQILKAHRAYAEAVLTQLGVHTGQEFILLQLADEEGITQSQIAECLGVEPPTVTKMLQRMEAAGLVERRQDREDARVSRVYLTAHSRTLIQPILDAWAELEEHTLAGLTKAERMILFQLLEQIKANFDKS
jgi:DNA-binding MarR family transcriptional regulator